jgi:hypothetical protein
MSFSLSFRRAPPMVIIISLTALCMLIPTEVEYIAVSVAVREAVWLRNLLADSFGQMLEPTFIHCDNQSYMRLSVNSVSHDNIDCSRHWEARQLAARVIIIDTRTLNSLKDHFPWYESPRG